MTQRVSGEVEQGYLLVTDGDMPYRLTEKGYATDFQRGAEYDYLNRYARSLNFLRYETVELKREA